MFAQEENTKQKDTLSLFLNYVEKLSNAFDENDQDFFINSFSKKTIDSIIPDNTDQKYVDVYRKAVKTGLKTFVAKLYMDMGNGSYYDFINYSRTEEENSYHAMFRLYNEDTGINYHQYRISLKDSTFIINDIFTLLDGDFLSESLKTTLNNSYKRDSDKDADLYKKFLVLKNMGLDSKAYSVAKKIKDTTFLNKIFLILKAQAASEVSTNEYIKCLKDILKKYPSDPSLTLLSIDYYYLSNDFNNLFRALEHLERYTNDDFIKYMVGNYAYEIEDFHLAQESYEYIVKNYPTFLSAELMLLHTYNKLNSNKEAIKVLDNLLQNGYTKKQLINFVKTDINDFYKTKDFKSWKRHH
ncbi:hypothetical protein NBRC110019_27920 [Neptunitalea chrysea]|uniref:Uncharacterized protein n=1 Tax=Neptunitalea chrysea TaxID=1647581 RepID=A0A9W6EW39_9FLAO|nr:hypothetical protein NBRC110019_27920 [Neptunitalea chrysea]